MTCCKTTEEENRKNTTAAWFTINVLYPYEHIICFQMSSAVWSSVWTDRNKPHEPAWSWTPFSGFFIWKPGGFTQDVRSGAALPSVRQTIIAGWRFKANEPWICWDYLHERLLWHIQPTITRKTLNIIWWILRAIKPLQPLTSKTQNLKTLSQKQSVLQHKSNHTL